MKQGKEHTYFAIHEENFPEKTNKHEMTGLIVHKLFTASTLLTAMSECSQQWNTGFLFDLTYLSQNSPQV